MSSICHVIDLSCHRSVMSPVSPPAMAALAFTDCIGFRVYSNYYLGAYLVLLDIWDVIWEISTQLECRGVTEGATYVQN